MTGGDAEVASPGWRPTASASALRARASALATIRQFFSQREVLEVQTPLLGVATVTDPEIQAFSASSASDGAHCGYLQTSTEYHQKRLLAAGIGDNYTLGPVFRPDEQGRLHNPEFTMLEWYRLGFNDRDLMRELAELVDLLLGPAEYQYHRYATLLEGATLSAAEQKDIPCADQEDLRLVRAIDELGAGRHFITDYPAEAAVLARLDPVDPSIARRFELVVAGVEIANGYFELTSPDLHRERFAADNTIRAERGVAPVAVDTALLGAIDAGLPDCAGVAVGFDRLLMLKLGASTLAQVQAFSWSRR